MSRLLFYIFCLTLLMPAYLFGQGTRLLREPTVSDDHIVFAYANDLWIVGHDGGEAQRLTSFPGTETDPHFSEDGSRIAFTGHYEGDSDVFVVSVEGGQPKRITHHPSGDQVRGWTTDGKVFFMSKRQGGPRLRSQIWTVDPDKGGLPRRIKVPRAFEADLHEDGRRLAYEMVNSHDPEWRNYRGGQAQPIRVLDLKTMDMYKLPWNGSRDREPVWLGNTIYFLSDRDYAMNVWSYNTKTGNLNQVTSHNEYDVKGMDAGGGLVVYEQAGYLHLHNPKKNTTRQLEIQVRGDLPWTRPDWKKVSDNIQDAALSPTGERALFSARGEVFTVPTEHGDWRNLTESSGARDRAPVWSPGGEKIAWFSDASGEYKLYITDQKGLTKPRTIELPGPTFYYNLRWSPDGSHLMFTDVDLNIWVLDVSSGETTKVDTDQYATPGRSINARWSPDGDWIAYAKQMDNLHHAVMLYSMKTGKTTQVSDSLIDARNPVWGANGNYLHFRGSTNFGLDSGWLDMSSYGRPTVFGIYTAVLEKDGKSPLLPRSDEEATDQSSKDESEKSDSGDKQSDKKEDEEVNVQVDPEGIGDRIVSLGVDKRIYSDLTAGPEGTLFYLEHPDMEGKTTLERYDFDKRKASTYMKDIQQFKISHDRKKLLYKSNGTWGVVSTSGSPSSGDGKISLDLQAKIYPKKEWKQIFREAWRYQRDFLYVENIHGANWQAVYERYRPWLKSAQHREDLNYVLSVMGGEVSVGHSYTAGGDMPDIDNVTVGLLGADYKIQNGRYRITKIYEGEPWTDEEGPLAAPGVNVEEGDYLLAVDGTELTGSENIYALFEETAGRQVILTINEEPTMEGAEKVTVKPIRSERDLRRIEWIRSNRKRVAEWSNGKLGYVYLPNTSNEGYKAFTREYFAQQRHEGMIIDERFNGGGSAADYMVNVMNRKLIGYFNNPVEDRTPFTEPGAGHWGPKVMLINEMAGSGGDLLPYMFRKMDIGPLVGTRTWGGLVGIWGVPPLIDGGFMTAPRGGFFNTKGEWDVENEGVAPDIKVEMIPRAVENGKDPQLRRAVKEALDRLKEKDVELKEEPPAPVRVKRPGNDDSK